MGHERERRAGIEVFSRAQGTARVATVDRDDANGLDEAALESVGEPGENAFVDLPVAVLRVPAVDLEEPVFDDISERNLNRGAGWIPGTAAPNEGGNMAIAGHRDQYFRALEGVELGDLLELESLADRQDYRVTHLTIVEPENLWPLDAAQVSTFTLVTCYPFRFIGSAPRRYIVQAVAVD